MSPIKMNVLYLLEENILENTPANEGDSYYVVSEDRSTTVVSDNNDTESNSQEEPLQMRKYQN